VRENDKKLEVEKKKVERKLDDLLNVSKEGKKEGDEYLDKINILIEIENDAVVSSDNKDLKNSKTLKNKKKKKKAKHKKKSKKKKGETRFVNSDSYADVVTVDFGD
jgi:transposase